MKKRILSMSLAVIVLAMAIIGATLAWLQDTTDPVVNTFTEGKVDIDLLEHKYNPETKQLTTEEIRNNGNTYKMVPGDELPKDPTVVVKADSEACWLFVKVEEINNVDTFLSYTIDTSVWTPLVDTDGDGVADNGVYYQEITSYTANDTSYNVLKDNQVTVNTSVNMDDMNALTEDTRPQLKFTAYAIQSANIEDTNDNGAADEAWAALNP